MVVQRPKRSYVREDFTINSWSDVAHYLNELVDRELKTLTAFKQWLSDKSELEAILAEDLAWRYIRMTIDTRNQAFTEAYTFFVKEIQPNLASFDDQLNRKLVNCPHHASLDDSAHKIYFRNISTELQLFTEKNIPLQTDIAEKSQQYGAISGNQSVQIDGEEVTLQQAALRLKDTNEAIRKETFEKIAERRLKDTDKLNDLFSELIRLRHQVALNAGFSNYRDYKFKELGRFDYTKEDCFDFHQTIKTAIVPILKNLQEKQAQLLNKSKLKPWDTEVDPMGKAPLKPFENGSELLEKTIQLFHAIDPYFGDCLTTMDKMNHLDLESKNGKSPGGYNYPLYEIGVPFIFMNAVGSHRDLVTMIHEGGHAVHSFLSRKLPLTAFKSLPSEVAELASMSMELITMDRWDIFYTNSTDLQRAKIEQLETLLKILPWIATIDEFQHWIYTHPEHSHEQRKEKWIEINDSYSGGLIDWSGYEDVKASLWQRQLHLFEVPFYYIEYGFAQLGALAVWKNYKNDPSQCIADYKAALSLGYTQSIPEIYKTAGISFDFSEDYIKQLVTFIKEELSIINAEQ